MLGEFAVSSTPLEVLQPEDFGLLVFPQHHILGDSETEPRQDRARELYSVISLFSAYK